MHVSGCSRRSLEPRTHVLFHESTTYPHPHRPYCHFHDQNKERVSRGQVETGCVAWSLASGEVLERQAWWTEEARGAPLYTQQQRDLGRTCATHFLENCPSTQTSRKSGWERHPCAHAVAQGTGSTATRAPGHCLVEGTTRLGDR